MESTQDKRTAEKQEAIVVKPEMKPKPSPNTDLLGDLQYIPRGFLLSGIKVPELRFITLGSIVNVNWEE